MVEYQLAARGILDAAVLRTMGELPRDKELLVFCQVGLRGYIACRILTQMGFKCRNLTGGYKTYCEVHGIGGKAATLGREVKSDSGEKA